MRSTSAKDVDVAGLQEEVERLREENLDLLEAVRPMIMLLLC